jgi:hypothetical protein
MAAQASAKTPPAGEKSAKKKLTFGMQHAAKTPSKLGVLRLLRAVLFATMSVPCLRAEGLLTRQE